MSQERSATRPILFVPRSLVRLFSLPITVELLYSDQVGRQRTIPRFSLTPAGDSWLVGLNRHWYLDWEGPRPESLTLAAAEAIRRDHDAAVERQTAAQAERASTDSSSPVDREGNSSIPIPPIKQACRSVSIGTASGAPSLPADEGRIPHPFTSSSMTGSHAQSRRGGSSGGFRIRAEPSGAEQRQLSCSVTTDGGRFSEGQPDQ